MRAVAVVAALVLSAPAFADTIIDDWAKVTPPAPPDLKTVVVDPKTDALLLLDFNGRDAAGSGPCNRATKPRCLASLPGVKATLEKARAHGVFVVYSETPNAPSADIQPDVAPRPGEPIVRSFADKFVNTDLNAVLQAKGIKRLIVTGTASEGAVLATAADAAFHGYTVVIPVDGMSSTEPYAEQYVAWHFAHAPTVSARATLTALDRLEF